MIESVAAPLKEQVKAFWEANPCDVKEAEPALDEAYFQTFAQQRYASHPYIAAFADFEASAGQRVLEVGIGVGTDFCQWAAAGAKAVGVDLTTQAVQLTTQHLRALALSADVHLADCEDLPFADHSFDVVYSFGVLHHTPNTERAIGEVLRVLKPGGRIRIMLYHKRSWVTLKVYLLHGLLALRPWASLDRLLADHMESRGTKAYTVAEVQAMFAGFEGVSVQPTLTCYDTWRGYETSPRGRWLTWARRLWPAWLVRQCGDRFGWNLLISGTKSAPPRLGRPMPKAMSRFLKLRHMSSREVGLRLRQRSYQTWERWRHRRDRQLMTDESLWAQLQLPSGTSTAAALWTYYRQRSAPRFFLDQQPSEDLRQLMLTQFPALLPNALAEAKAAMQQQFTLLGHQVAYAGAIDWHADPTGAQATPWPQVFYADVPLANETLPHGDVKYVWELNRHAFLMALGKAYWLTGESAYADAAIDLMQQWIEANPYNTGVNWTNALEPAYRALAWIWTYAWCREALSPDFLVVFLKSLYQHARYIHAHLEYYTSPYNHLIGEATTLFWIGTLFPEFKAAQTWADCGWQILETELDRQFYADGFTVEQASGYHYATLGFYLMAVLLRQLNGWPVSARIWSRLESAITFSVHLTQPNGCVPRIGDSDDARPMQLAPRPPWDFRDFHAVGAVLFDRPDFKYAAGDYAEEALWLLGTSGYHRFANLADVAPTALSKAFPASGYYLMRTGWDCEAHWSCIDIGPQAAGLSGGPVPSAAHGHADALSVLITAYGEPVLVDGGPYYYNGAPAWRDYFRQTRAHNTVVVDGADQAVHHSGMAWSNAIPPTCEAWTSTPGYDYVCGLHTGFARLPAPVRHRRAVFFRKPDYWLIFDELEGTGLHQVESYLHVASSILEAQTNRVVATLRASGRQVTVLLAGAPLHMSLETASQPDRPDSGWIGVGYGCRRPAPVLRWHAQFALPQRWCMLVTGGGGDWQLDCQPDGVVVQGDGRTDRFDWPGLASGKFCFRLDGCDRTEIAALGMES